MNMSFKEKSIWISLVVNLLVLGSYFAFALNTFSKAVFSPDTDYTKTYALIPPFIGAVVLITIVLVVLQTTLAFIFAKEAQEREDERDRLIHLKAGRVSYYILVTGVWATCASLLMNIPAFAMANLMVFFFFVAEIVGMSTQLFYYQRGV